MVRTRSFDPDAALETAMAVFWDKGFKQTSIEDLVAASGVSRYGWYGTFGNKEDIYRSALQHYITHLMDIIQVDLRRPDAGRAELLSYFIKLADMADTEQLRKGCMACNAANDQAVNDPELAAYLSDKHNELRGLFENAIRNGQAAGTIRQDLSAETLAMTVFTIEQGLAVLHHRGTPIDQLGLTIQALHHILD